VVENSLSLKLQAFSCLLNPSKHILGTKQTVLLYVENASSLRPSVHLDVMQMQIAQIPVAVLLQLEPSILYKKQQGQHRRDLNKIQGVVWYKPGPACVYLWGLRKLAYTLEACMWLGGM
jgi:hypothetical protein